MKSLALPALFVITVCTCATSLQGQESSDSRALRLLDNAKKSASEIPDRSAAKSELLQEIAIAQATAGDAAASERTFQEILKAASEKEETRNVALAKVRAGDLKGAVTLAEPLKEGWILVHRDPLSGLSSTRVGSLRTDTLEKIVQLLLEKKRWKEAHGVIQLLPETKREGYQDDMTSRQEALMKLVVAQARSGDSKDALLASKEIVSSYYLGLALQEVVTSQVQRGELQQASQVVDEMTHPHLKLPCLLAIAAGQSSTGDEKGAAATFSKAVSLAKTLIDFRGGRPSSRASALTRIAVAQLKAGDRAAAQDTMQQATLGAGEADLGTIAVGQARLGAFDLAVAKVELIADPWRKLHALADIAVEVSEAGERAKAAVLLTKARTIAASIKEEYQRTRSLLPIGKAQLQSGDADAALTTARDMMDVSEQSELVQLIVKARIASADLKGARSAAGVPKTDWERNRALREVALAQARARDSKSAVEMVIAFQGTIREVSLGELISILADQGEMELAHQTVSRMEGMESKGQALRNMASVQVKNGDETGATAWASASEGPFERAYSLLGVAEGILKKESRPR